MSTSGPGSGDKDLDFNFDDIFSATDVGFNTKLIHADDNLSSFLQSIGSSTTSISGQATSNGGAPQDFQMYGYQQQPNHLLIQQQVQQQQQQELQRQQELQQQQQLQAQMQAQQQQVQAAQYQLQQLQQQQQQQQQGTTTASGSLGQNGAGVQPPQAQPQSQAQTQPPQPSTPLSYVPGSGSGPGAGNTNANGNGNAMGNRSGNESPVGGAVAASPMMEPSKSYTNLPFYPQGTDPMQIPTSNPTHLQQQQLQQQLQMRSAQQHQHHQSQGQGQGQGQNQSSGSAGQNGQNTQNRTYVLENFTYSKSTHPNSEKAEKILENITDGYVTVYNSGTSAIMGILSYLNPQKICINNSGYQVRCLLNQLS
ncbi:unnamed protein product [Ambrosiozyma monospora]|uniref:Unnamed protein product n=1 Tax=Ambrosiozyma monospora TaxID=43982 RepID=A0ACB5TD23_AMBMO|nr:unnamed protein product [Ambrosiozyma monospora]